MNGWRRGWVVCCALLVAAPVYLYTTYIPSDEKLNSDHQKWVDRERAEIKIIEEPVQGSNRLIREALMKTPVSERLAVIQRGEAQHAEFMANVSKQRPLTIATFAGAWLVLCALLYLLGMSIAWVIEGFRKGKPI